MTNSFENIAVISFPDILENEFNPIEKKYLNVIYINILSFLFTFIFAIFLVDITKIIDIHSFSIWMYLAIILVFFVIFSIKQIGFRRRKYLVRNKDISYKNGLFLMKTTTVPFNRIQHIEINQGPFSRFFDLAILSIFTAGNSSHDLKIRGIKISEAEKIKEFISSKIDG